MAPPRLNVYVPRDLRQRMDRFGQDVNWSALACSTFERKLADLASDRKALSREEIAERLIAQRRGAESADADRRDQARDAGRRWARDNARFEQLAALDGVTPLGPDAALRFWAGLGHTDDAGPGGPAADPTFVLGFVAGALDVWTSVRDLIADSA